MIWLETSGRVFKQEIEENETVGQTISKFKLQNRVHFNGDSYSLKETQTGRELLDAEILMDNRHYYLTAWLVPA